MSDKPQATRGEAKEGAKRDVSRILSEIAALHPTSFWWIITLGTDAPFPKKDIRNVEFQFLGADDQVIPFDVLSADIWTTTGGNGGFEIRYLDGGWGGHCFNGPDKPGFRTYVVSMLFDGPRPKVLKVRLTQAGGDDCDVRLRASAGDLLQGVAAGTEWQNLSIPE